MRSRPTVLSCWLLILLTSGCAIQTSAPRNERSPDDPWEPLNRHIHSFNSGLDRLTLKPIAKGYQVVVPRLLRIGIGNFSDNLRTPLNIINNLLQGKGKAGLIESGRLLANSTFGLLGILDVATDMGLEKHDEDFGQTLATWGVPAGPYVVLPFLGPQTLRGAVSTPLNLLADPLFWYDNSSARDKIYLLRLVDIRQRFLKAESLLEGSQDRYISLREAYLQNRTFQIYDGDPPEDDDFYDEFLEDEDELQN